ncbi:paraquat-inducible protein A [Sulfurovum sp.]|uniref:paraquat-inducible protein A n=1 Tax=Sulfurovum sp. TaxID=1969726 RepID=UPI002867F6F7|nr:paraquat-inducible protein A [Sulfurovum sp.]
MKLENEDALDNYIICHQCFTLHEEVPIEDGSKACCTECGGILYRYDSKLISHGLALSITGLIFFILANVFPLIQMDILGTEQFITMPKTIFSLIDNGFYLVGFLCLFLIFIFPLMIFLINIVLFLLLKLERGRKTTKELLILLAHITPWSMADIFLISILVALVKLVAFGQIHIGIAFWALMIFVLIDVYITKRIHLSELWILRKRILQKGRHL